MTPSTTNTIRLSEILLIIVIIFIVWILFCILLVETYKFLIRRNSKTIINLKDCKDKSYTLNVNENISAIYFEYQFPYEVIEFNKEDLEEYKEYETKIAKKVKNVAKLKLKLKNNTTGETRGINLIYTKRGPYLERAQLDPLRWRGTLWQFRSSYLYLNNKNYFNFFEGNDYEIKIHYTGTKGYNFKLNTK